MFGFILAMGISWTSSQSMIRLKSYQVSEIFERIGRDLYESSEPNVDIK